MLKTELSQTVVRLADSEQDIKAAQRLRYRVFVEELGGAGGLVDHEGCFERDHFDQFSDQLVLVDESRAPDSLEHVVGVYRLMRSDHAALADQFYSETEYDLAALKTSGRRLLELGRSCLDPAFRGGTAMFQLWQGLSDYVNEHGIDVLFGVASFHGTDVQAWTQSLSHLHHAHLAPEELRPRSRVYQTMDLVPADQIDRAAAMKVTPALIKAYLRLGGMIGDGAFIDHDFNTIDVCLVMDTERMSAKHRNLYETPRST